MTATDALITPKKRIDSIDILRGIVMVIMVIDHTRDFFTGGNYDPTDLSKVSTVMFLTRFITHYCAATFVFLAGTGAYLYLNLSKGKTKGQAFSFLISRGLWLIFLELTVVNLGFSLGQGPIFLQVIWAIGCSMLVLAFLIWLPVPVITAFGLVLIFGHNAFDYVQPASLSEPTKTLWIFLHVQSMAHIFGRDIFVLYPLIPWVGVMAAGYGFGQLFKLEPDKRKKILLIIGIAAIALFAIIRYFNIYGKPFLWNTENTMHRPFLAFINVNKYPPSLDYLLLTLGPAILLLALLDNASNKLTNILVVYGRVPMFYYLLHLYLLHILAFIYTLITGPIKGQGAGLPIVYLNWFIAVFILYFPCRWFMNYKRTHKQWWLGYL